MPPVTSVTMLTSARKAQEPFESVMKRNVTSRPTTRCDRRRRAASRVLPPTSDRTRSCASPRPRLAQRIAPTKAKPTSRRPSRRSHQRRGVGPHGTRRPSPSQNTDVGAQQCLPAFHLLLAPRSPRSCHTVPSVQTTPPWPDPIAKSPRSTAATRTGAYSPPNPFLGQRMRRPIRHGRPSGGHCSQQWGARMTTCPRSLRWSQFCQQRRGWQSDRTRLPSHITRRIHHLRSVGGPRRPRETRHPAAGPGRPRSRWRTVYRPGQTQRRQPRGRVQGCPRRQLATRSPKPISMPVACDTPPNRDAEFRTVGDRTRSARPCPPQRASPPNWRRCKADSPESNLRRNPSKDTATRHNMPHTAWKGCWSGASLARA